MTPSQFTLIFLLALAMSTALRLWLDMRHLRHVIVHREQVPPDFAGRIELADHRKAADYTVAKVRVGMLEIAVDTVVLLVLTIGGVLGMIDQALRTLLGGGYLHGLALFACVGVLGFFIGLPASLYRTFRIEARFGFNKLTWPLWFADLAKGAALTVLIGGPLLFAVLWLMEAMGKHWWLYVWLVWLGTNLLVLFLYPTVIAPLFNKFTPLEDASLKQRIETLLTRCGFTSSGLFVMDGSKRSAHGNAYFTGFGRAKRIVFFDTLLEKLAPQEIEAVLAHELGHFKHRHVIKRIALSGVLSLAFLWLLGQLIDQPWFFAGLGVGAGGTAMGLLLFSMVLPVFLFPLAPLTSALSRKHEYEADAYAAQQTAASDLVAALVKLYRDNAATLTPDPLHSLFHDSHPPASQRIARLHSA
ncbi:M48 family metallopeptidase [Sulfuritalea hydrogenivorans]|uniref:Ste24 endopeptidase n=1 Tax=Sulfuritalea hydrogenivorans sk43H TaxID=1223802 RepID=W0SE80_9PROT|nr:M48 family metallopeptidase [Sulfuritalea hydrogenivorans]BAO29085.1 Ste24 endopeptidase [Sulfuritalea hydrogenivorans sk43H]